MDKEHKTSGHLQTAAAGVVTPFPGGPAANLRHNASNVLQYGLQPGASESVYELAQTLKTVRDLCQPHALAAAAKASLRAYLCEPKLLASQHRIGDASAYKRHLLYADPERQFSILAIVWNPGQHTAIHGHTAWGAVGVYEGSPYCEIFDTAAQDRPCMQLEPTMKLRLKAGDMATVQPGIDDVHRIGNDGIRKAITIHIYGRDLLAQPGSINITFN